MSQISFLSYFQNKLSFILGLVVIVFICSCGKDDPQPIFTNSVIQGLIRFPQSHDPIANTKVIAHGPYGEKSVFSDSSGLYQLSGLGNGTYVLEFKKENYGIQHQYGLQLFGNDTIYRNEVLYEKIAGYSLPKFYEILDHKSVSAISENDIVIETNQETGAMPVRVFLDNHKDVNYKNFEYTLRVYPKAIVGFHNLLMCIPDVYQLPYQSGQEVFLILYVYNPDEPDEFDNYLGVIFYSTLDRKKHSIVMSFIMP